MGSKNQKEFLKDLKLVYGAVSKEAAETELLNLEAKWKEQYPLSLSLGTIESTSQIVLQDLMTMKCVLSFDLKFASSFSLASPPCPLASKTGL